MSGSELSQHQDSLAQGWNDPERGPGSVYNFIRLADRSFLEELAMANIGKRAHDLEQA